MKYIVRSLLSSPGQRGRSEGLGFRLLLSILLSDWDRVDRERCVLHTALCCVADQMGREASRSPSRHSPASLHSAPSLLVQGPSLMVVGPDNGHHPEQTVFQGLQVCLACINTAYTSLPLMAISAGSSTSPSLLGASSSSLSPPMN